MFSTIVAVKFHCGACQAVVTASPEHESEVRSWASTHYAPHPCEVLVRVPALLGGGTIWIPC